MYTVITYYVDDSYYNLHDVLHCYYFLTTRYGMITFSKLNK